MPNIIECRKCPYCNGKYSIREEAIECAIECLSVDMQPPIHSIKILCSICGKDCGDEMEATECEYTHSDSEDKYYNEFMRLKNIEALARAGNDPRQQRLL